MVPDENGLSQEGKNTKQNKTPILHKVARQKTDHSKGPSCSSPPEGKRALRPADILVGTLNDTSRP